MVSLFRAAADFSAERYNAHIKVKETFALNEVLKLATTIHPSFLKGITTVEDADNKAMHGACKKERSQNAQTHYLIKKLLRHHLEGDPTLKLRWVCSEENWAADSLTRQDCVRSFVENLGGVRCGLDGNRRLGPAILFIHGFRRTAQPGKTYLTTT